MISLSLTDATGLVGVVAYIGAHFAVQVLHKSPTSKLVIALNVIGPACILISLTGAFNLASFLTQVFWLVLTVVGWWRKRIARTAVQGKTPANPARQRAMR